MGMAGWQEYKIPGGVEPLTRDVAWWRDMLIALHFWAIGAVVLATLGLASTKVALEQDHARGLFHNTKREAFLEGPCPENPTRHPTIPRRPCSSRECWGTETK